MLLQMLSGLDIGRCASENVGLSKGVDCEIPRWWERGTKHSDMKKSKEDNIY